MRFNDLMQTVLAAEGRAGLGAVTLWRQCVDLLAQHDRADGTPMMADDRAELLARLTQLRPNLSETQRMATVVELGRRLRSATLVEFFAHDRPSIAAAAIARANLPDAIWAGLLPQLTPTARGVLRGRRDVGVKTRQGLEAFGSSDLVLTTERVDLVGVADMVLTADMMAQDASPGVTPLPTPANDGNQIRKLVDRIARFTSARQASIPASGEPSGGARPAIVVETVDTDPTRGFAFETDSSGTILWVDQGPRAALIGLSLGEVALDGGSGPDGHVAGAFARRSGVQNGRFSVVGGAMAGEWRVSATPYFDLRSGRFQGYRGQARRPFLHEVASAQATAHIPLAGLSSDSLRQLVHELRTPLNAILGFAEIIEQELFGPAGEEYRDMAGKIAVDARHLLSAFDDLDMAARASRGDGGGVTRLIDPEMMVMQIAARFTDHGGKDGCPINLSMAQGLPMIRIDPVQGERMIQHLLRTVISLTPAGETVTGAGWFQPDSNNGQVVLAIDRPSTLDGMDESQLLDPGDLADGDWADGPLLGLGFSLRLIRSLVSGCGGVLNIEAGRLMLVIPAAVALEDTVEQA